VSNFKYVAVVAQNFLIIVAAYVLCHGITAFVVKPVQELFIPHVTIFASLIYLPHGVRVLATWMMGWRAIIPLFTGSYLSNLLLTSNEVRAVTDPVILQSVTVGALSAYVAFGLMKASGRDIAANGGRIMDWKWLLIVGAIASVVNSVGQSIVYSGLILPDEALATLATFAVGDLVGLAVNMFVLLLIFRWLRLFSGSR
jgi:hypothetical protein